MLKPSKIHRKSTIDQAAKAAKYIHNTTWNVNFSPKFNKVVGIAMIKKGFWEISQKFKININGKFVSGEICNLPIV